MSDALNEKNRQALLVGIGLDNKDGHVRVTRGDEFVLLGGSQGTHEEMQETATRLTAELSRRGKRMADVTREELVEIVNEARRHRD